MYDEEDLEAIRESREAWEEETLADYFDHGERKDKFVTVSNHEVDRLYTPEDIADIDLD